MQTGNFKYEKQGAYTFLTYEMGEKDSIDNVGVGMITNNKIEGLLPMVYTQIDDNKYFKYNITSKVSLREFFSGIVNKERLVKAFKSILIAINNTEEYMLEQKNLVFDVDYIFVNVSTSEAEMICIPLVLNENEDNDILSFFKNILFTVRFDQSESNDYIGKIMNYLNSSSELQPQVFIELLNSIENDGRSNMVNNNVKPSDNMNNQYRNTPNNANINKNAGINNNQFNTNTNNNYPKTKNMGNVNVSIPQKNVINNINAMNQQNIHGPNNAAMPGMANPKSINNKKVMKQKNNNVYKGMEIPGRQNNQVNKIQNKAVMNGNVPEKEISWFYLMQHYNKENAAMYKEQKARKKANKNMQQQPYPMNQGNGRNIPVQRQNMNSQANYAPNQNQRIIYNNMPGNNFNNQKMQNNNLNIQQRQNNQNNINVGQMQNNQNGNINGGKLLNNQNNNANSQYGQNFQNRNAAFEQRVQAVNGINLPNNVVNNNDNFGDTVLLDESLDSGETTLLNAGNNAREIKPYLLRVKTNEKIYVDKPVFKIGKERKYVDYCIEGNSAISRSHASIIYKENKYFVIDTNSTNHTYVDEEKIDSNTEVKIKHGTKLRFANEDFEFHVF